MIVVNNQNMCTCMYTIFLFVRFVNLKNFICKSNIRLYTLTLKIVLHDLSYHTFFWIIGIQEIDRSIPYEDGTIHGTRYLHSIQTKSFQNVFAFDSRKQSCFCHICIENIECTKVCEKIMNNYVKHWKHTEINPKGKMPLASIEEL